MRTTTKTYILTALLALTLATPLALAHTGAIVVENDIQGRRCYIYTTDTTQEFWVESNGYLGDPSTPQGVAIVNHVAPGLMPGSGLQRGPVVVNGQTIPADTRLDVEEWAHECTEEDDGHDDG